MNIDLKELRRLAEHVRGHEGASMMVPVAAIIALLDRLEKAEAERDAAYRALDDAMAWIEAQRAIGIGKGLRWDQHAPAIAAARAFAETEGRSDG